jgi:synaptobrevin family protein YKT6
MKLLAVALLVNKGQETEAVCLGNAFDLSSFGYFQRGAVRELLTFTIRTVAQRTVPGQRQTVKQEDYFCHVHVKESGLAGVAVTDAEYPTLAAFSVVGKAIDDYVAQQGDNWRNRTADTTEAVQILEGALQKYQDPAAADKLTKIQRDLDETKIVLHQTIESVLKRGEKLDSLVDKSHDLSMASQMFYKQARRTNSCCKMM